ncbi:MAG TPA: glycosyltransferase family 4 protein [Chitinophagaceae bacterium]|nr:glycosyltransferase family 4 protein [Chitinophagaceae bacterium]
MRFVDVSYFNNDTSDAGLLLHAHAANLGYLDFLPENWEVYLVKLLKNEGQVSSGRTNFHFFRNSLRANRFIRQLKPDAVLAHGLIFPLQMLALPSKTKIIIQHHAERPGKGLMRSLQKLADKFVSGYLFSTKELAEPWINAGIIRREKVYEVMEGSSVMERMDKQTARKQLGLEDGPVFLWVGRLDANKDPLTVLAGFERYLQHEPSAKLYMIYQSGDLLPASINPSVTLVGKVERSELSAWYSAADYYISGSHSEGSGYALIEAMSCGCIPVVTDIPSFRKITGGGLLFKPGDVNSLYDTLLKLNSQAVPDVLKKFEEELSFKAIAKGIGRTISSLP